MSAWEQLTCSAKASVSIEGGVVLNKVSHRNNLRVVFGQTVKEYNRKEIMTKHIFFID